MPTVVVRSSNCCIGGAPPSPESIPNRPSTSLNVRPSKKLTKDPLPAWTTKNEAELQAILEENFQSDMIEVEPVLLTMSKAMSSHNRKAISQGAFLDDSDEELDVVITKKSSGTLHAVTERLKSHLYAESRPGKRDSRASIGTSEEEVERRAELRRIRQRRIQEELSNESIYDDDAKSLDSVTASSPAGNQESAIERLPKITLPPALTPPSLPHPTVVLSELSPTTSPHKAGTTPNTPRTGRSRSNSMDLSTKLVNSRGSQSRKHSFVSSPTIAALNIDEHGPMVYLPLRRTSTIIPAPPDVPILQPPRLPSFNNADGGSSWRLSFSSNSRGEILRKLSIGSAAGRAIPITLDTDKITSSQVLPRRMHNPGLRNSSSQEILGSQDSTIADSMASHTATCRGSADFGGVDGGGDGTDTIHLHEMGVSQRLAPKAHTLQGSTPSAQLFSVTGIHTRDHSSMSGTYQDAVAELSHLVQHSEGSVTICETVPGPETWGSIILGSSSRYSSTRNSAQQSGQSSRFSLSALLPRSKSKTIDMAVEEPPVLGEQEILPTSSVLREEPKHSKELLPTLATNPMINKSSTSLPNPITRYPPQAGADDNSGLASETSSFREREEELEEVRKRFGSSRRVLSTPVCSKFREEFEANIPKTPPGVSRRYSVLVRLAKLARVNYDGPKVEDLLDGMVSELEPGTPTSPGPTGDYALGGISGHAEDDENNFTYQANTKAMDVNQKLRVVAKASLLGKKSNKGTGPDTRGLMKLPIPTTYPDEPSSLEIMSPSGLGVILGGLKSPGIGGGIFSHDDNTNVFGNAFKNQADDTAKEKISKPNILGIGMSPGVQKSNVVVSKEKPKRGFGALFGRKKREKTAAKLLAESQAAEEFVMDSWEAEMDAVAGQSKVKSRNIVKKKDTRPDYRYPKSWSRFSSHDRAERAQAGSADKVDVKDFANLGVKDGEIVWCLAHDEQGHHTSIDGLNRNKWFGERLLEKVEKELYEFDTQDDQAAQTGGRRGSLAVSAELEFPELEILPITFMDSDQITQNEANKAAFIHEAMKEEELDELAKMLGGGFFGDMALERDMDALSSPSDWEDEMVKSVSSTEELATGASLGVVDPGFYADCVMLNKSTFASPSNSPKRTTAGNHTLRIDQLEKLLQIPPDATDRSPNASPPLMDKKDKYRTWSGKDWDGYRYPGSSRGKYTSLGSVVMKKSTDDLLGEMIQSEIDERYSLLKAVEDAFGSHRGDKRIA